MPSTFKIIVSVLVAISTYGLVASRETKPVQAVQQRLVLQVDSFAVFVHSLQQIPADAAHTRQLQMAFIQMRLAYKKLEWATEYFDPLTTQQVNGPPVPETELNGQVIQPDGLQVTEQLLFPVLSSKIKLNTLLARLFVNATKYEAFFRRAELQDWQILDAVKLEIFHVETLGLNRFDDPLSGNCFNESAVALASLQTVMAQYPSGEQVNNRFNLAIHYLLRPVKFNAFDRAAFLTGYANPLTIALIRFRKKLALPDVRYNRLLNQDAATLFAPDAFNRNAFISAPEDSATIEKIVLGKKLFFDPGLSGTMTRSCASCHRPEKAFTDRLMKNTDLSGKKFITRNTPSLINAALQAAQFYDTRVTSLEDQAADVMQNRDEMHGNMKVCTQKLWHDTAYRRLFSMAFPVKGRVAIDTFEVMNALAGYVRSLTALNSRFDVYMRGHQKAMSAHELRGFNLFMGKARCATCHYLPLFNGTLPPRYVRLDAEVIGVPQTRVDKRIDSDPGLYGLSSYAFNNHAFKTPSVRNAARTAPYMHNGVFRTLEEVVDFYDKGGGIGIGIKLDNQTLDVAPLHLTVMEKKALVAFIKSLDSR